jgi:hypothetical protein
MVINTSNTVCSKRGALQGVDLKKSSDSDEDVTHSSPFLASPLPDFTTLCATTPPRSPTKHSKRARKTIKAVCRTNSIAISECCYSRRTSCTAPKRERTNPRRGPTQQQRADATAFTHDKTTPSTLCEYESETACAKYSDYTTASAKYSDRDRRTTCRNRR